MKKYADILMALIMVLLLCACGNGKTEVSISKTFITEGALDAATAFSDENEYFDYTKQENTVIYLNGNKAEIKGAGATASEKEVTITAAGTYVLSGNYQGTVCIEASLEDTVNLVLENVILESKDGPAIYEVKSEKTVILLPENTNNTVKDAATYSDTSKDAPSAAIYAKDDLTITGEGVLNVTGNNNDGITSKASLKIMSGIITVDAKDDCLVGKDLLAVNSGTLKLTSGGHGLKATKEEDEENGIVLISGGDITINAEGDGINATNSVVVSEMNLTISAGDDGIHADKKLNILGGTISILKSCEGLEAVSITIEGGQISVVSSDDGINANGGTEGMGPGAGFGRLGNDTENITDSGTDSENPSLVINGGNISINSLGDGLDSNGSITMNGGYVYVSGPTDNGNNATDYQDVFIMNGGTIIACGSAGMYQSVSADSKCFAIDYIAGSVITAGTECFLYDGENLLYSFVNEKSAAAILISGEKLEADKEYTLIIGDEKITVIAGTGKSLSFFGRFGKEKDFGEGGFGEKGSRFNENMTPPDWEGDIPAMPFAPGNEERGPFMPANGENVPFVPEISRSDDKNN